MEGKPVIILGGGLLGSLLAYRLKETLPHIPFRLYEESSSLNHHRDWIVQHADILDSVHWLKPFITHSWRNHRIRIKAKQHHSYNPQYLISGERIHQLITKKIESELKLCNAISTELAMSEGSFVIDARNICHVKHKAFKKLLMMELELSHTHKLSAPLIQHKTGDGREFSREVGFYPLDEKKIFIKDSRYALNEIIDMELMRNELLNSLNEKEFKINKIIKEHATVHVIPISSPSFRQEGRVVNLAGLFHDNTSCPVAFSTQLIERLIKTSFRFGELKEVVKSFRNEIEGSRKFYRTINQIAFEKTNSGSDANALLTMKMMPSALHERYRRGHLSYQDKFKILWDHPELRLKVLKSSLFPNEKLKLWKMSSELSSFFF